MTTHRARGPPRTRRSRRSPEPHPGGPRGPPGRAPRASRGPVNGSGPAQRRAPRRSADEPAAGHARSSHGAARRASARRPRPSRSATARGRRGGRAARRTAGDVTSAAGGDGGAPVPPRGGASAESTSRQNGSTLPARWTERYSMCCFPATAMGPGYRVTGPPSDAELRAGHAGARGRRRPRRAGPSPPRRRGSSRARWCRAPRTGPALRLRPPRCRSRPSRARRARRAPPATARCRPHGTVRPLSGSHAVPVRRSSSAVQHPRGRPPSETTPQGTGRPARPGERDGPAYAASGAPSTA